MKTITLTEAESNLRKYAKICQKERITVTIDGKPAFEMYAPDDDDLVDKLIATNPEFRKLLKSRVNGKHVSSEEASKWFE